jgi:hypothetical protein
MAGGRPQSPITLPQPPLWAKWVISFAVVIVAMTALVIFVDRHNSNASNGLPLTAAGRASSNRLAVILADQEQAPHLVKPAAGATQTTAIAHAIRVQMNGLINDQQAGPPVATPRCNTTTGTTAIHGFSCSDLAGGQYFDFVGVIDTSTRVVTVCEREPPPQGTQSVPISKRCLA